jgi:trans-aconitate 2-methyltransferase
MIGKSVRWDAEDYSRNSSAQLQWARELIAKLHLRGSEHVLDIGCGNGNVTAILSELLPGGRVVGIDVSEDMIAAAHQRFPDPSFKNLRFLRMDAAAIDFDDRFDIAFSNAVLHWVRDQSSVLKGVAGILKNGGRLLFQMGGKGNAHELIAVLEALTSRPPWDSFFRGFSFPYTFLDPEEYHGLLLQAGLGEAKVELIPREMKQKGKDGFAGWIRTTWMPYTERIPLDLRERFISEIVDSYMRDHPVDADGQVILRMVRLEVEARKA